MRWLMDMWPLIKRTLTWGFVAFLIFFIAYRPDSATTVFQSLGDGLRNVAIGVGHFFAGLIV